MSSFHKQPSQEAHPSIPGTISKKKLFLFGMLGFTILLSNILYKMNLSQELIVVVGGFIISVCLVLFRKSILNLYKHERHSITVVWIVCYLAILILHCYNTNDYFNSSQVAFCFGYLSALCEKLMTIRVQRIVFRIIFGVGIAIVRMQILPPNDQSLFLLQALCLFQTIFSEVEKSKSQNDRFRNLVTQHLSEGILVVDEGINKCLFANNSFKAMLRETTYDIKKLLNQFSLNEAPQINLKEHGKVKILSRETLFGFITKADLTSKKVLCNVSYLDKTYSEQPFRRDESYAVTITHLTWEKQPSYLLVFNEVVPNQNELESPKIGYYRDRVLSTVSHELKTPLNSMLGVVQILQSQLKDKDTQYYLDICNKSGNLLLGLVNSILDLNLMRISKLKLEPEIVDVTALMKNVINLFEYSCIQKGLSLKSTISSKVPQFIETDKNRLLQIFIHLVGNAMKFTKQGGITIAVKNATENDDIEFSVEDSGVGITDEEKQKLLLLRFNKDYQEGLGVGLTISQKLALLLGKKNDEEGGIKLESEHGRGSKFTFRIKRSLTQLTTEQIEFSETLSFAETQVFDRAGGIGKKMMSYETAQMKSIPTSERLSFWDSKSFEHQNTQNEIFFEHEIEFARRKSKAVSILDVPQQPGKSFYPFVLIIDDNPLNILIAEHFIRQNGCGSKTGLSGKEAIEILTKNDHIKEPVNLILMDIQMPVMDGYQTTRVLKQMMSEGRIPNIPIAALTANNTQEDKEACRAAGMCHHLSKPLEANQLTSLIQEYCYFSNGTKG